MARKSLALALIIVLVVSMSLAFILPNSSLLGPKKSNSDTKYAGYTAIPLYNNTNTNVQVGSYNYAFAYHPTTIINNSTIEGSLTICRQGILTPTEFPLTTNTSHDYYTVTFAITKINSNYITVMVNVI